MGSDQTITNGQHQDVPANKPTPWTNSSGNPLIAFESDHGKTNSLGDHPTAVT